MSKLALPDRLVVGVDGSEDSSRALRWAVTVAEVRGAGLQVVTALPRPVLASPSGVAVLLTDAYDEALAARAEAVRRQVAVAADEYAGEVEVSVVPGDAVSVLVELSGARTQLVLGSRGLGGFRRLLLGSVSDATAHHAEGPVTVVRAGGTGSSVVVGVDGSRSSDAALAFAVGRARELAAPLVVVHAWEAFDGGPWPVHEPGIVPPMRAFEDAAREDLERFSATVRDADDLQVSTHLVHASPGAALAEASATARELVVGARGAGGVLGARLGSTSSQVLHHATCTTTVVRGWTDSPAATHSRRTP